MGWSRQVQWRLQRSCPGCLQYSLLCIVLLQLHSTPPVGGARKSFVLPLDHRGQREWEAASGEFLQLKIVLSLRAWGAYEATREISRIHRVLDDATRTVPVKRHRGAGTHTGRTQDTRAHKGTRVTPTKAQTSQPSNHPNRFKDTGGAGTHTRQTQEPHKPRHNTSL